MMNDDDDVSGDEGNHLDDGEQLRETSPAPNSRFAMFSGTVSPMAWIRQTKLSFTPSSTPASTAQSSSSSSTKSKYLVSTPNELSSISMKENLSSFPSFSSLISPASKSLTSTHKKTTDEIITHTPSSCIKVSSSTSPTFPTFSRRPPKSSVSSSVNSNNNAVIQTPDSARKSNTKRIVKVQSRYRQAASAAATPRSAALKSASLTTPRVSQSSSTGQTHSTTAISVRRNESMKKKRMIDNSSTPKTLSKNNTLSVSRNTSLRKQTKLLRQTQCRKENISVETPLSKCTKPSSSVSSLRSSRQSRIRSSSSRQPVKSVVKKKPSFSKSIESGAKISRSISKSREASSARSTTLQSVALLSSVVWQQRYLLAILKSLRSKSVLQFKAWIMHCGNVMRQSCSRSLHTQMRLNAHLHKSHIQRTIDIQKDVFHTIDNRLEAVSSCHSAMTSALTDSTLHLPTTAVTWQNEDLARALTHAQSLVKKFLSTFGSSRDKVEHIQTSVCALDDVVDKHTNSLRDCLHLLHRVTAAENQERSLSVQLCESVDRNTRMS